MARDVEETDEMSRMPARRPPTRRCDLHPGVPRREGGELVGGRCEAGWVGVGAGWGLF
jgi:hypothetical protein